MSVEIDMFWDGLFHALTWTCTAVGIGLLWRAVHRPDALLDTRVLVGAIVLGWGLFNLVEGVIDHHLLGLHHVVERLGVSIYDYAFLASGAIFMAVGLALVRAGVHPPGLGR